jgi:hypothetical protein
MFIGHYCTALVAAAHPKAPGLGSLFVAAQLVDIGFFTLVLADVEHMRITPGMTAMNPFDLYHMPITHSLLGSLAWAAGFAVILRLWLGNWMAGLIGGAVVLSHWFIDLIVHIPDLTLAGGDNKLGFGLWNWPALARPLEIGLTFGAFWLYVAQTRATRVSAAMPVLILFLFAVQIFNWFGPQPTMLEPSLPISGLAAFGVAAALAAWLGRSRTPIAISGVKS